jgi:hypothetical protein
MHEAAAAIDASRRRGPFREAWSSLGRATKLALAAAAVAAIARAVASWIPDWTETGYSRGVYPWIQHSQSALARLSPISLGEVTTLLAMGVALALCARAIRAALEPTSDRSVRIARELLRLAAFGGALYALYMFGWGLNYARAPYAQGTALELRPADAAELEDATREWMQRASELRERLGEDSQGTVSLQIEFRELAQLVDEAWLRAGLHDSRLEGPQPALRASNVSSLMRSAGISGIYWPFTGEPHINALVPPSQLAFSALHEVAHQRGFAREDEANYLACRVGVDSSDPRLAYPAALAAFLHLSRGLREADAERAKQLEAEVPAALRRDRAALAAFWKPSTPLVASVREASSRVNDAYLKSQGQSQGVRSYGRMVDLLLAERRAAQVR